MSRLDKPDNWPLDLPCIRKMEYTVPRWLMDYIADSFPISFIWPRSTPARVISWNPIALALSRTEMMDTELEGI